ncbi:hypothetical protein M501DRAFT_996808 [Patellaria atrata CBS 101060]|uniref:DNA mismatch repair proteins mutS family domain-containing protein n=1 Tax=Patellaria atrata CBS 101060 TaxID=1346257 RepID=A0A9P4S5N7_9PEZI|nr:hypothetical protein M501DRAFT_996808 [Patellaria atrata CBS 101060]
MRRGQYAGQSLRVWLLFLFPENSSSKFIHPVLLSRSANTRSKRTPFQRHPITTAHTHRAKKKTTIEFSELPQGIVKSTLPIPVEEDDGPVYSPVVQQARNNMRKFNHCVLLTRVGNFYELYFEHAEEFAPLLNLKQATRYPSLKSGAPPYPIAGFPYYQLDRYLKVLVQDLRKHVAISEEIPNDASDEAKSGLQNDRKVTRVVTPGTLIDEKFMDPWENNYLLAIHLENRNRTQRSLEEIEVKKKDAQLSDITSSIGLAWLDLSSGEFFTQSTNMESLATAVARIGPREIVVDCTTEDNDGHPFAAIMKEDRHTITYYKADYNLTSLNDSISSISKTVTGFKQANFTENELTAAGFLLDYVRSRLQGVEAKVQAPMPHADSEYMSIDKSSLRALEIKATLRDGVLEGSLLHAVRKTVTKSGTRLLTQRLVSPSMSLSTINERLNLVTEMLGDHIMRQDIVALLRRTHDTARLVQKFSFGRGDADDLLGISRTIQITEQIVNALREHVSNKEVHDDKSPIGKMIEKFILKEPLALSTRILEAIDEEGLSLTHSIEEEEVAERVDLAASILADEAAGAKIEDLPKRQRSRSNITTTRGLISDRDDIWIMRKEASPTLRRLHNELDQLYKEKDNLGKTLNEQLGTSNLTLRWAPGLGHYVYITGRDVRASFSEFPTARTVRSSKSTKSLHLPSWTRLGERLDESKSRIRGEETRVFSSLRKLVLHSLLKLRCNAALLDELDVAASFAGLAESNNLVRPDLNRGTSHHIVAGRHPVVERALQTSGRSFTPNDCAVGCPGDQILLITGPNMAGKSTFLRQNALISILAQTGSYVPAAYASLGLVDAIFTRVGSADDLYADRSTFMLEMLETARILRAATKRSFVVMDEVGRGTTPEDGVAVAFAALHHLKFVNKSRTLFATHFYRLADMTEGWKGVGRWCSDVTENDELHEERGKRSWVYVHRLKEGVNRNSHALKVARMAGMPVEAMRIAEKALKEMKRERRERHIGVYEGE